MATTLSLLSPISLSFNHSNATAVSTRRLSLGSSSLNQRNPSKFVTKALSTPSPALIQDDLKKLAADKAVEYVKSGMVLGLGTGSTAAFVVTKIGDLIKSGELTDIVSVPTSKRTQEQAASLNIPLSTLDAHPHLDLAIDGADEVDPNLDLVKGRGGALLREKMVEAASDNYAPVSYKDLEKMSWTGQLSFTGRLIGEFTLEPETKCLVFLVNSPDWQHAKSGCCLGCKPHELNTGSSLQSSVFKGGLTFASSSSPECSWYIILSHRQWYCRRCRSCEQWVLQCKLAYCTGKEWSWWLDFDE
ncbi:probable ribose-5-phosphate isomerase 3, chloroplastic [Olea europaea var. sylvestris]|uniref:probable ribose-5-phosphate isomerase 3, chloroplastic n=1 Tax=Olea europaea var. sylvestris TaxID=158386 RepID=UPI000C1D08B0|nr:probable ribose-5-phosphate isomerase 3, chloroplastic [Olea europaea var. sylvestris]